MERAPNKFPKQLLHEFYQLHGTEIEKRLSFEVEELRGCFKCTVTCPGVVSKIFNFDEFTVTAEGKNKKASMHEASARALLHLQGIRMLPAYMQPSEVTVPSGNPDNNESRHIHIAASLERLCSQLDEGLSKNANAGNNDIDSADHNLSAEQVQSMLRATYWGMRELAASIKAN